MEDVHGIARYAIEATVAAFLLAVIAYSIHVIAESRTQRALHRIAQHGTFNALQSFLESATTNQPLVDFAQRGFQALSGEMVFLDARLDKKISTDIPVYDLHEWNTSPHKDLPSRIDIDEKGIAVKFEHPGIWYEMVFTSHRGYGTISTRRYMLAAVANRIQELLLMYERQDKRRKNK